MMIYIRIVFTCHLVLAFTGQRTTAYTSTTMGIFRLPHRTTPLPHLPFQIRPLI